MKMLGILYKKSGCRRAVGEQLSVRYNWDNFGTVQNEKFMTSLSVIVLSYYHFYKVFEQA